MLFSTGGAAIKSVSMSGWQVAGFRSAVAAVVVLLFVPEARRNWSRRAWLVGLAYAATLILFVQANKLTTAANTIFLQSTAPFYLLLLGPWLLKEPIRRTDLGLLAVVSAGMSLFFVGRQTPLGTAPYPLAGNVLALFSGVTWALTLAGLRWLNRDQGEAGQGMATVAVGNTMAFLLCVPKAVPVSFSMPDFVMILYLGAIQIGLAYALLNRGLRTVPALEGSLLLLAEPVLNPVWAALVHKERPSGLALLGGALILGASLGRTLLRRGA
jgi:DME family drug/metabolite transporter